MLFATWRPTTCHPGVSLAFAAHLHGRELLVERPDVPGEDEASAPEARDAAVAPSPSPALDHPCHRWHWLVAAPSGRILAQGDAEDRRSAEEAAEDEVEAVHPPSDNLVEALLG